MYNAQRRTQGYQGYSSGYNRGGQEQQKHYELTEGNYVDTADRIMKEMKDADVLKRITTSKIRNILSMVSDIYNDVRRTRTERLDTEILERLQYLRLHIAYEAGRDQNVKDFVTKADLLNQIQKIGSDRRRLILFCHYMEALTAYHRFYGGKDN